MRNLTPPPSEQIVSEASAWFIEFRTGTPSQQDRDRFNTWIRTSPQHIQAYFDVAAAWSELPNADPDNRIDLDQMIAVARATPDNLVQPSVWNTQSSRLRNARRHGIDFRTIAIAASVLIVLAAGFAGWELFLRGVYHTGIGEQRTLKLADGSSIELNARSHVVIRLTEKERYIQLRQGQALFHVAKDLERPFIVQSDATRIRAVGTQFDVYKKDAGIIVTVVEGRVAVESVSTQAEPGPEAQSETDTSSRAMRTVEGESLAASTGESVHSIQEARKGTPSASGSAMKELFISAGEQAIVTDKSTFKTREPDIAAATAWTQKRLVFEDTPLVDVAEEFNRYNTIPLIIKDSELAHVGVSGLYSSTDPTTLIEFLKSQPTIEVSESDGEIIISSRRDYH